MKEFNCLCCGDCCSGNMDIKLNLYDLYKMGKHLKLSSTKELFEKRYLTLTMGQNGIKIPQIIFKTFPYKFCPFLINDMNENMELKGFCSLHPYIKPLVCILAPISKEYDSDKITSEYCFTKPTENCPGKLVGEELPIKTILTPIKNEIKFENNFYDLLNIIKENSIDAYTQDLYYFNLDKSYPEIFTEIKSTLNLKLRNLSS